MNNLKCDIFKLLVESILISRYARDIRDRTINAEKELHIKIMADDPDIAQETINVINHAEKTAFALGEILNIEEERILFSIEVIKSIRDVMDDDELLDLIEMHLTCSDEDFQKMLINNLKNEG